MIYYSYLYEKKKKITLRILSSFFCKKKNPPCPVKLASASTEQKTTFWGFIQLIRWARCDLYYIFNVTDRFRQKKNNNTGVGGNGSHSSGSGRDGIFPQFFRGIGTGWD